MKLDDIVPDHTEIALGAGIIITGIDLKTAIRCEINDLVDAAIERFEAEKKRKAKHNHVLYWVWLAMRKRCFSKNCPKYADYGARGITICEEWSDFWQFVKDMGERPKGMTIERIDNNGPYSPSNCRWATMFDQAKNRRPKHGRPAKQYIYKGQSKTIDQWAYTIGIESNSLRRRIKVHGPIKAFELTSIINLDQT